MAKIKMLIIEKRETIIVSWYFREIILKLINKAFTTSLYGI